MFPKNVATGLYSNWDSFVNVDYKVLDWIKKSLKTEPKEIVLRSIEEASYTLDKALIKGGKEFLISEEIYSVLNSLFKNRRRALGGNGFHMGRALYELGFEPLVSYPSRPNNIMIASPEFKIACEEGFKPPKEAVIDNDPEYDHIIFEFKRDLKEGVLTTGRHIFSWDMVSSNGIFDYHFLEKASDSRFIDILIIGYAHLLLPNYKKKSDEIIECLDNPKRPKVHFELGMGSEESVRYAMKKFSDRGCTESWGMNEDECRAFLNAESTNLRDLIEASLEGIRIYGLKRICVHSAEFALSVSKYDIKKELEALEIGCGVATALTFGSIKENLDKVKSLPRSNVEAIKTQIDGYNLCLIPTFVNNKPESLTGLGDTFAGIQAAIVLS
ncbi:MAG: hypothetical protein L6N96_01385 [Candidatus Methylarchaceae archaeon HK02M2]|nr:hypothetical protein [Candidatus Methylarchaceae archaeon HK02M2]